MTANSFRDRLLAGLGGPWPEPCPLDAQLDSTVDACGYRLERVIFAVEPQERIPALVLIPEGVSPSRPARESACGTSTTASGTWARASRPAWPDNPMHHTGVASGMRRLCRALYRRTGLRGPAARLPLQAGDLERFLFLKYVVAGKCLAWKNILDMRRAVDYLASRPDVCSDRLRLLRSFHGVDAHLARRPVGTAAEGSVGNCCLPTYAGIHREHLLHCFPNFIPGIHPYGDTPDIAALIAPCALHLNSGTMDGGSPIDEVRRGIEVIRSAYRAQQAESQFTSYIEEGTGHELSARCGLASGNSSPSTSGSR